MLTNDQIVSKIESSFMPFRCVAEIWDYDSKLRFKVFDEKDQVIVEMPSVVLSGIRQESHLDNILSQVRLRIQDKGYALDPTGE